MTSTKQNQSKQTRLVTLDRVKVGALVTDVRGNQSFKSGVKGELDHAVEVFARIDDILPDVREVPELERFRAPSDPNPQYKTIEDHFAEGFCTLSDEALDRVGDTLGAPRGWAVDDISYRRVLIEVVEALKATRSPRESAPVTNKIRPNYYKVQIRAADVYTGDDGELYLEVECQDVIDALDLNFNRGNALKYLWRAGRKTPDALEDVKKARQYLDFEIQKKESGK